ncbi:MAG: hypothetical protein M3Y87_03220 [Myxococcota bacterium]|nr:hypothetical protein [Myxococcota bacterium]
MRPLCFSPLAQSLLLATVSLLGLAACGDGNVAPDAGPTDDAYVLQASRLFGSCVEDSQCPGEGAVCRRDDDGYPRGYCTIPCDDRTPCDLFGSYHHCVQRTGETRRYCEQRCLNGIDCGRPGYTCAGELPPSGGLCLGVCSSDAHCSAGHVCEPYSGQCYPEGSVPTAGALTGEPCGSGAACLSGLCIEEVDDDGAPTGYLGGTCVSNCILPSGYNTSTFFGGTMLPRGDCVGNAVCFPTSSLSEGDLGVCQQACAGDGDCRPGLQCASSFNTSSGRPASFDNGVCLPIDCSRAACPSGSRCVGVPRADGSVSNICAP